MARMSPKGFQRRIPTVLPALAAGLLWSAAGPGTAAAPTFQIIIDSGSPYYMPASATVTTGAAVRWDNPTASHHTVTHDGCSIDDPDGAPTGCAFDSGSVAPNGSFTLPGLPPGRYPYHCSLHPIMRGVLIVVEPMTIPAQT
ncbi:MAG: hypothetical protein AB1411_11430 [Nitrospirota bacterium]